jgi:hypothetical protein
MSRQDKEGNDREVVDELPPVPCDFFMYCGSAKAEGNSMYRCLKCPTGSFGKKISCSDKSRQNLKKHIQVFNIFVLYYDHRNSP